MVPPLLVADATHLIRRQGAIGSLYNAWVAVRATSEVTFTRTAPEGTSLDFYLARSQSMPAPPCWFLSSYFPLSKPLDLFSLLSAIVRFCQVYAGMSL